MGSPAVAILLAALSVAALALAGAALALVYQTQRRFATIQRASKTLANGGLFGLEQVLREQGLQISQSADRLKELERRQHDTDVALLAAIRHIGVIRFDAYQGSGGVQSFAVALLNAERSGIVISSLQNRSDSRVYAKPVQRGASRFALSDEEAKAIEMAVASPVELSTP